MASPLEPAIRESIRDARLWPATQEIEEIDDPVARDLTYEVILRIAECDKGHRTEAEIKALLAPYAPAEVLGARG